MFIQIITQTGGPNMKILKQDFKPQEHIYGEIKYIFVIT